MVLVGAQAENLTRFESGLARVSRAVGITVYLGVPRMSLGR